MPVRMFDTCLTPVFFCVLFSSCNALQLSALTAGSTLKSNLEVLEAGLAHEKKTAVSKERADQFVQDAQDAQADREDIMAILGENTGAMVDEDDLLAEFDNELMKESLMQETPAVPSAPVSTCRFVRLTFSLRSTYQSFALDCLPIPHLRVGTFDGVWDPLISAATQIHRR